MIKPADDFLFGSTDLHLFAEGTHARLYDKLGAHPAKRGKVKGTCFAVWAPNAARVGVIGDFNGWGEPRWLTARDTAGIWEGFVEGIGPGALYKYRVESRFNDYRVDKCDPLAFACEMPPATSARVAELDYAWTDGDWMKSASERQGLRSPMSIYELHLGSWRRVPEDGNRSLTYRELAPELAAYVEQMGFTHVEIMPVAEHPFYGSWGYQVTGFFAPSARYGTPEDFMFLVDTLHQHGIGVILDWTPAHFPTDEHGLIFFDGTHLYEHADPRQGIHPDWGSAIFNYGRNEVRSFLISNACFWVDRYHIDGLRVDAVASMLYLDYARRDGDWVPNRYGGRENIEAIELLRTCNEAVYRHFPHAQTIAEESTAWPMVSRPTYIGGLGFGYKWDMGWMHDTLSYMQQDPVHRPYHHQSLTFRGLYAFSENFVLPLSHDEVVHGKGSLIGKMPGDTWQRFANLRLLYCYQWAQPGKKLLFMGGEFGQWREWTHEGSLDWHLLQEGPHHRGVSLLVGELNRLYRHERGLHAGDADPSGLSWIDANDVTHSVLAFLRRSGPAEDDVLCVFNFTPVPRHNYRLGVDVDGYWQEILNSDATAFGGSGQGNQGGVEAAPYPSHGRTFSIVITLPPLAAVFLRVTPPAGPSGP